MLGTLSHMSRRCLAEQGQADRVSPLTSKSAFNPPRLIGLSTQSVGAVPVVSNKGSEQWLQVKETEVTKGYSATRDR